MAENPLKLPKLGLGTWPMKPAETKNTVLKAIEIGYRFIDTAQTYRNEEGVGAALAENTIDRNELNYCDQSLAIQLCTAKIYSQCNRKSKKTSSWHY